MSHMESCSSSCGGIFNNHFIKHLLLNVPVKKFRLKIVQNLKEYNENLLVYFFEPSCI